MTITDRVKKLLVKELQEVINLDDKIHSRETVLAEVQKCFSEHRFPKGFVQPRVPKVPASVQDEVQLAFIEMNKRVTNEVKGMIIRFRRKDLNDLRAQRQEAERAFTEKFESLGEQAVQALGAALSQLPAIREHLANASIDLLNAEEKKQKLNRVFNPIAKQKASVDADAEKLLAPDIMEEHDPVDDLKKKVDALEAKLKRKAPKGLPHHVRINPLKSMTARTTGGKIKNPISPKRIRILPKNLPKTP